MTTSTTTNQARKIPLSSLDVESSAPGESFELPLYLGEPSETVTVRTTDDRTYSVEIHDSWENQYADVSTPVFTLVEFVR